MKTNFEIKSRNRGEMEGEKLDKSSWAKNEYELPCKKVLYKYHFGYNNNMKGKFKYVYQYQ